MGALTIKAQAFSLRSWDTECFESLDPTDGFGSNTRVFVNSNSIILIEPEYNIFTSNTWLTDKGRQFFDGIFKTEFMQKSKLVSESLLKINCLLQYSIHVYDHCNKQINKNNFFTIVFENLSIEVLSLLITISQNFSFINLKRAENFKIENDLESNFQLNVTTNKAKLLNSTLSLLISSNIRYEGYFLNLSLRQRFYRGNFRCLTVGSLTNSTIPAFFMGSTLNCLKTLVEGKNLICQSLKFSQNPITIFNNELLKRVDGNSIIKMLKTLKYSNIFNKTWNTLNGFSSTLSETGTQNIGKFLPLTKSDFVDSSIVYFLNINANNINDLNNRTRIKLLSCYSKYKFILDQSTTKTKNFAITSSSKLNYSFIPVSVFYENEETFINTEGQIKKTSKIIFRKKTKNHWQLIRKFFKNFKTNLNFLNIKENNLIYFNSKRFSRFKNFIYFSYQASHSLTSLNFYLSLKTLSFNFLNNKFKFQHIKFITTKLKYWLDDFYNGGKDEYSQNSSVLSSCSKILRLESTNFF